MYQQILRRFGNFDSFELSPPPSISCLFIMALNARGSWVESDGPKDEIAKVTFALISYCLSEVPVGVIRLSFKSMPVYPLVLDCLNLPMKTILILKIVDTAVLSQLNADLLICKADMLREYFGVEVDEEGNLCALPIILDQYTPDTDRICDFVFNLGSNVRDFLII